MNHISSNREYGVHCGEESNTNLIFNNNFTHNNNGQTQGNDDGIDNQWHDETIQKGNYWSDWSGYGSYQIDGEANAANLYPEGKQGIGNNIRLIFLVGVLVSKE